MSERSRRIEETALAAHFALENWLRDLPSRYIGKPLTQDDVTVVADASNHLRAALRDRRRSNTLAAIATPPPAPKPERKEGDG